MVFTIEPGIYVPNVGGVRIEDDIYITKDGSNFNEVPERVTICKIIKRRLDFFILYFKFSTIFSSYLSSHLITISIGSSLEIGAQLTQEDFISTFAPL